ncbi:MAG: putative ABC exporter domain-containing protein [Oscillospiraceae bacterium]|nr:putative ABC exporter domain-containing protein [Oscillospiraceae bacterium]
MNALSYVLLRDAKNKLLDLRRRPAKLVMYLIVIGALVGVVLMTVFQNHEAQTFSDIMWFKAIAMAFFLFTLIISIKQGLSKGTTMFSMEDVNNLFVSPVRPQSILIYGLVRMMKTTLLSTIFILFNTNTLQNFFNINFGGVLIVFAAFVLVSAVSQLLTLVIYSLTNSKPRRQLAVRVITALALAPLVITGVWNVIAVDMNLSAGLLELMNSPVSSFTPVVGWAAAGALGFISGNIGAGMLFFGMLVAAGAILVAVIYIGKPDYYEDVLVATETAFEKMRDAADGNISAVSVSDKEVKVKGTGVGGYGASALFYKHVRESFRANRFGLWGISTVVLVAAAVGYGLLIDNLGGAGSGEVLTLLIMLMFAQLFLTGTGRGVMDTYNHYIYMIPESSFKKLVWSNLEVLLKVAVQNILVLGAGGLVMGEAVYVIAASVAACTLLSFVILGVSFLSMRFTQSHMSVGILSMLYFLAIAIVLAPGIAGAIIAGSLLSVNGLVIGLLILAVWELIAGSICFAASKGVLHNCDMPTMTQMSKK